MIESSSDDDARAEEQQLKTAYTVRLQVFWDLHPEVMKYTTQA